MEIPTVPRRTSKKNAVCEDKEEDEPEPRPEDIGARLPFMLRRMNRLFRLTMVWPPDPDKHARTKANLWVKAAALEYKFLTLRQDTEEAIRDAVKASYKD